MKFGWTVEESEILFAIPLGFDFREGEAEGRVDEVLYICTYSLVN